MDIVVIYYNLNLDDTLLNLSDKKQKFNNKQELYNYLYSNSHEKIVILTSHEYTDDIPSLYPCILFSHNIIDHIENRDQHNTLIINPTEIQNNSKYKHVICDKNDTKGLKKLVLELFINTLFRPIVYPVSDKIFWQYPVITEKFIKNQLVEKYSLNNNVSKSEIFLCIPFATIIDKMQNNKRDHIEWKWLEAIKSIIIMRKTILKNIKINTYCQHIYYNYINDLLKSWQIDNYYIAHKRKNETYMDGINLFGMPLYPKTTMDNNNLKYNYSELKKTHRKYLFNFIGAHGNHYINNIRQCILSWKSCDNVFIRDTKSWHYENSVYGKQIGANWVTEQQMSAKSFNQQNIKENIFRDVILDSKFTLCPVGAGPNTIRLWECLAMGSIPVIICDEFDINDFIPTNFNREEFYINIPYNDDRIKSKENLIEYLNNISEDKIKKYIDNGYTLIQQYVKEGFIFNRNKIEKKNIVHYCCGTYFRGYAGGVPQYDHNIYKICPERIFFRGPDEKNELLKYLNENPNTTVITDNHLSCDIPNNIETLLVHHGSAKTHAIREPEWGEPWRSLCCNGQEQMLDYRDTKTTTILSISQFCTDEFMKYYGDKYLKFNIIHMLHPSEMEECKFKTAFNKFPQVLGNFKDVNKGKNLIPQLKANINDFEFNQLSINIINNNIEDFNKRKLELYLNHDIFLQISNSEGNSYATLDALASGLVVVSSNVGLFYKDVPDNCFVKLDWEKNGDVKYVEEKLKYAWDNREQLSKNARKWYLDNCRFNLWRLKMKKILNK